MSTDVGVLTVGSDLITGSVEVLHNLEWMPSGVAVDEPQTLPSERPRLHANYPNPFSAVTTVRFTLTEASPVQLIVFDLLGRRVATVLDEIHSAGDHKVRFDGDGLASGVYLYRISAGQFVEKRRMVVVRLMRVRAGPGDGRSRHADVVVVEVTATSLGDRETGCDARLWRVRVMTRDSPDPNFRSANDQPPSRSSHDECH